MNNYTEFLEFNWYINYYLIIRIITSKKKIKKKSKCNKYQNAYNALFC